MRRSLPCFVVSVGLYCLVAGGCSGVRTAEKTYVAHGTAFHLFGLQIPDDSLKLAESRVPEGATMETISGGPSDWTSFWGVLNRILGFNCAAIGGKLAP